MKYLDAFLAKGAKVTAGSMAMLPGEAKGAKATAGTMAMPPGEDTGLKVIAGDMSSHPAEAAPPSPGSQPQGTDKTGRREAGYFCRFCQRPRGIPRMVTTTPCVRMPGVPGMLLQQVEVPDLVEWLGNR
jgi:hypothetical protein